MMLLFLAIITGLVLLVLAFIVPALLWPKPVSSSDAEAEKRALYRQQFAELEQDRLNSVLDVSQYALAKNELERRMLDEIGVTGLTGVTMKSSKADRRLALILLVLLPVSAFLIYLKLGSVVSISQPVVAASALVAEQNGDSRLLAGDIEPLLQSLQKKLQANPEDGAGWALLGRSYVEMQRYPEAVSAFATAFKLLPADAQLLADYADAAAVVNDYQLTGLPEQLIAQALKIDPKHSKALMLAASAAFNRKDYPLSISYWQRLEQTLPADSALWPEVKAALKALHALPVKPIVAEPLSIATTDKIASATGISGTVRISAALAGKLAPTATLFVFARAAQGPPMPLAIVRKLGRDLPYRFHLDDSTALSPEYMLSQAGEVVIVARISNSGDAKPQAGDLQGMSARVKLGANKVDIEINQQLP
jgi:cytochrome c-type biogenesis protein CcmH